MPERNTELDPADICHRLRAGDADAFQLLVRRHHGRMLGVARALTGNAPLAEDVVQETWLKAIEGIAALDRPEALVSWIYAILANTARSRAAREWRTVQFVGAEDAADTADHGQGGNMPAVAPDSFTARGFWRVRVAQWDDMDPERIVAGREIWAHVRAAIDELPDGQRAVILLRDVEGLEHEDIRRILQISDGNLRVLLHRGRGRLRLFLDDLLA